MLAPASARANTMAIPIPPFSPPPSAPPIPLPLSPPVPIAPFPCKLMLSFTPSAVGGEDAVLDGEQSGRSTGGRADLGVDVLDVMIGGLHRDHEWVGDLARREAEADEAQHLGLPRRKSCRECRPSRPSMTGR